MCKVFLFSKEISFSLENSGRISGVRSGRISGVGRHRVPLTISVSIVESLMLIGMAVDSIVPRFRTGFSISLTISFSFTFHNMHSTTGVGIIPVVIVWLHEMAIVWLLNKSSSIEGHRVSGLIVVIERITRISLLLESRGITKSI